MPTLELLNGSHTLHLFGGTLSLGPAGLAAIVGWMLFAAGALFAVRERITGTRIGALPPIVSAGATLGAMSAGLGLLLLESYPAFARNFCLPYALLAFVAAVLGHALQAGGSPIGEE
ncbi:MAG TPA: hypothetical protein VGP25_19150 [Gemmatimonadaceae bacterium]|jgi:hypothetical protein|nr:hypothetical protein [Gemmatimonadaceae bacterium]